MESVVVKKPTKTKITMMITTKLEKKILTFFGIAIFMFFTSTLYLFQHVSSSEFLNNHPELRNSVDITMQSASQEHKRPHQNVISIVDQIPFLTSEEVDNTLMKIPFPQSIHNEEMEMIVHPAVDMMDFIHERDHNESDKSDNENKGGDDRQMLKVPKFWNPQSLLKKEIRSFLGNYGETLITPEEAKAVGSYTRQSSSSDEGKDDNQNKLLETIFVSIASYRDYRCPHTIRQLFAQATYPERIRVAIVDQIKQDVDTTCGKHACSSNSSNSSNQEEIDEDVLCKYSHLIDVYEMDATSAVGPVLARHIGNRMYRGEYFVMQSDAHMEFVNGWDVDIIQQWKSAKNEMAVLTTYVSDVDEHYNKTSGMRMVSSRPKMCNTDFDTDYYDSRLSNLMHGQQPEGRPDVIGEPTLHPFWAAGFSFSRGHFLVQVPYDQYLPMIFQGEEINIGLRGFTYGYDFYAPERSVIFHYYSKGGEDKKVKSFYENSDAYNGLEQASMARLLAITQLLPQGEIENNGSDTKNAVDTTTSKEAESSDAAESKNESDYEIIEWNGVEEKKYGIGKVRTIEKFLRTFGININTKQVQHHLCQFVGRPMNKMFLPSLRTDAMGINYDTITFEFKDPKVHGKTWEGDIGDDAGEEEEEEKGSE